MAEKEFFGRKWRLAAAIGIIFVLPATLVVSMILGFGLLKDIEPSENYLSESVPASAEFKLASHWSDTITVTHNRMEGLVRLVHFYDPECGEICEDRIQLVADVVYSVSKFKHFRALSFCLRDVEDRNQIWTFARSFNRWQEWHFLYGDQQQIQDAMAAYGLSERNFDLGSPQEVAVLDWKGNIRGYYDLGDPDQYAAVINDLIHLLRDIDPDEV
jgi:cytochrome oxidase Cu insertion factor (SCO1/SenC/PrrC family)